MQEIPSGNQSSRILDRWNLFLVTKLDHNLAQLPVPKYTSQHMCHQNDKGPYFPLKFVLAN